MTSRPLRIAVQLQQQQARYRRSVTVKRDRDMSLVTGKTKPPRDEVGGGSLWYFNDRGCS
jgi:hypothetical protein